jgi:UDP-N-acetylmuramate: L-alanyl-gamma-D-glutamyl-meso-diaminopimelate ligase
MPFIPGPAERVPEARPPVDYAKVKKVHLIGIGGSAMGNFAGMLQARGMEVRGSDAGVFHPMRGQLERWGIPFWDGYDAKNLDWGPDLVVVGNVVKRDNVEAEAMRAKNLPYCSFPEGLGEWMLPGRIPVVVAGTHGKTTTTSMLAWLLEASGLSPGLLVGGVPLNLGTSFRLGEGKPFVIEGDEYDTAYYDKRPKFVHYRPHHGVLTSVEFDHADIYPDFAAVQRAFRLYASLFPADGLLVAWGEDERVTAVLDACKGRVARYGFEGGLPLDVAIDLHGLGPDGARFSLYRPAGSQADLPWWPSETAILGPFLCPSPGRHNVLNATAALLLALDLGVTIAQAIAALAQFKSVRKRQELRGVVGGVSVIDDYAHHPTAVKETIAAIRGQYPGHRLWALFEAESNTSRRKVFETVYPDVFALADRVVLCSPLHKEGDKLKPDEIMDAGAVCQSIEAQGTSARFIPAVADIVDYVAGAAEPGDVVLAMSGRDFQGLHGALLERLKARFET